MGAQETSTLVPLHRGLDYDVDEGRLISHLSDAMGGAVMDYNDGPYADCSPHPFDVLAITALYQKTTGP